MTTNVTILIPGKKTYCDYAIQMEDVGARKTSSDFIKSFVIILMSSGAADRLKPTCVSEQ